MCQRLRGYNGQDRNVIPQTNVDEFIISFINRYFSAFNENSEKRMIDNLYYNVNSGEISEELYHRISESFDVVKTDMENLHNYKYNMDSSEKINGEELASKVSLSEYHIEEWNNNLEEAANLIGRLPYY